MPEANVQAAQRAPNDGLVRRVQKFDCTSEVESHPFARLGSGLRSRVDPWRSPKSRGVRARAARSFAAARRTRGRLRHISSPHLRRKGAACTSSMSAASAESVAGPAGIIADEGSPAAGTRGSRA
eukprot:16451521-Heterocapsa_arctica.AAC.3